MAAGRTSSSGGGQWTSTRTRVSMSARGSPSAGAAAAAVSASSALYEHEELLSRGVTGTSPSADDDSIPTTGSAYENNGEDDDDEWEDVGDEPVFRDLGLFESEEDSEYAPSENEDSDDDDHQQTSDCELSASDLEVEEEESSVAGLFASVVRHLGSTTKKRRAKDSSKQEDPAAFTEKDHEFWATPEEKQQWVARFDAANTQFVHQYGCCIDSPAYPEAKAKLRREKKKKNMYALILFALCVAFLVQMLALSTDTVLTVQSVAESVTKLTASLPRPTDVYKSVIGKVASLLPVSDNPESKSRATAATTTARDAVVVEEEAVVTIAETQVVKQTMANDAQDVTVERVIEVQVEEGAVVVHVETGIAADERLAEEPIVESESVQSVDEQEDSTLAATDAVDIASTVESTVAEPPHVEKEELAHSKVAVQLCSKLLNQLVKSRYDPGVKDTAIRACDAAIAIAPRKSEHWIEAHVLRGDLFSLVSEFDAADEDYNTAASAVVTTASASQEESSSLKLSQEVQTKILANRWISLFTKNRYKEFRQEVSKVVKDDQLHSAPLRALATDWLLVFKKKKQPLEVLTATKLCTLQRLTYE